MAGLFGQTNRRTQDLFSNMSAGQRFGQAAGNARNAADARGMQSAEMSRQAQMDDLTRQYKQAQIEQFNRPAPLPTTWNPIMNEQGMPIGQQNSLGKLDMFPVKQPKAPIIPKTKIINGIEYQEGVDAQGNLTRTPTSPIEQQQQANTAYQEKQFKKEQELIVRQDNAKLSKEMPLEEEKIKRAVSLLDDRLALLDGAIGHKGFKKSIGPLSDSWLGAASRAGDKDVANFKGDIAQIQAQITLQTLKDLKATGATMGALNEQEFLTLERAAANLDFSQGEEEYERQLLEIRDGIARIKEGYLNEFKIKYGNVRGGKDAAVSWAKKTNPVSKGYYGTNAKTPAVVNWEDM